jgi:hypothetical protein
LDVQGAKESILFELLSRHFGGICIAMDFTLKGILINQG